MARVALLGTLDTKGEEYHWLRDRLLENGVEVELIDTGSFSADSSADQASDLVLNAADVDVSEIRSRRDRGEMMAAMSRGAAVIVRRLFDEGNLHGLLAIGGSGGSSVAAPAMQSLPIGVPKLLVSTMASGDVRPYVGEVDASLMYPVVDVAGLNSVLTPVLDNAAAAIAAMAVAFERRQARALAVTESAPVVAISMFGVTTPAANEARETLAALGYEVLVFHATGAGGQAMERLVQEGRIAGVLDLTTTELCDDLVGGVLSAGPDRLEMAGQLGIPQVVSLGALDMVNFGPMETVPEQFRDRLLYVHNPTVTLMRTTPEESAELGRRVARKLSQAKGPTELFIPLGGVSAIDAPGMPFHSPEADQALFEAIRQGLKGSSVTLHESDDHINSDGFGRAMAQALDHQITQRKEAHV